MKEVNFTPEELMAQQAEFQIIINKMEHIFAEKNTIHGGDFFKAETPQETMVDITRKYNRIKGMIERDETYRYSEKFEDECLDLAVYSVMELIYHNRNRK